MVKFLGAISKRVIIPVTKLAETKWPFGSKTKVVLTTILFDRDFTRGFKMKCHCKILLALTILGARCLALPVRTTRRVIIGVVDYGPVLLLCSEASFISYFIVFSKKKRE